MERLKKLREIANAGPNALTRESKNYVYQVATELGLPFKRSKCKECVIELAVKCFKEIDQNSEKTKQNVRLKKGVRILVNGQPINEATCSTTEECLKAIEKGTPRKYFDFEDED